MRTFLKQYNTLKLDQFGVIQITKGDILFISNTGFVLVVPNFFPRFDDCLGKWKLICT
jgi:hypothetical protein